MMTLSRRNLMAALACGATLPLSTRLTQAAGLTKLRVAKVVPFAWVFTPLDIGMQEGIFAKNGLQIVETSTHGDAKLQQLLTADDIDIGIGSGPGMAFAAKGVPAKAVAAMYKAPLDMAVMVGYDSPIKTVADLKGKKLGCTTVGSLTAWIGQRINEKEGWDDHGIDVVPVGGMQPARADIKLHQLDGYIGAIDEGYRLERTKEWRIITSAAPFVDHFITHVLFARDELIAKHPDLVRAFLKGWFETIAYMKTHKEKSVEISAKVLNAPPAIISRAYDGEMAGFSADGTFDPKAVEVLKQSFIQMGRLKKIPPDNVLFTTQFVPVKVGG